jgi:hypothetical protein
MIACLLASSVLPMGCFKDPDATGEGGIGAPGVPPAKVLSDEEAYKLQQQRDAELSKESNRATKGPGPT